MLTQEEWKKLNETILNISKGKNSCTLRTIFLNDLMKLINFNLAEFTIGSIKNSKIPQLSDPIVVSIYDKAFEQNFENQYENVFAPLDYVNWVFLSTESLVYRESDLINPKIREKTPFYKYYLEPLELIHAAGIVICSNEKFLASVAIYKSRQRGDFTDKDLFILEHLLPYLQLAFETNPEFSNKQDSLPSYLLKTRYMLTDREVDIVGCIYKGLSNSAIAEQLGIAPNTVKKHIYNAFQKLEVTSRTKLIKVLRDNGLTTIFDEDI